jgi:hypothetical protein
MNFMNSAIYSKLQGTAITSLLSGSTAIYAVQAPDNATLPYIVYSIQGGGDENLDRHRTKNLVYFIRAYSQVSLAQAGSIDAAIDTALHLQTISPSGWSNFWTAREEDLTAVENLESGEKIWMAGGFYRFLVEDT